MTDLIERLRHFAKLVGFDLTPVLNEAADEIEHLRAVQPRYFTGCLQYGVCRGVCRNTDCPNYDLVVAARLVVEPREDGIVYPKIELSKMTTEGMK